MSGSPKLSAEAISTDYQSTEPQERDSLRLPEYSLPEWGTVFLLFAFSLLYLRPLYDYTILNADEGIILEGAHSILDGKVLYRDFFSFVTPGSYYWMALLFKIFGSSILVGRAALLIYGGLFSVFTYLLARRVCSTWAAIVGAYLFLVSCLPGRFIVLHNWDSALLACLSIYCAVWMFERPHWAWAFGTGCFLAFTALTEQSKGAGLLIGFVAAILILRPTSVWSRISKRAHLLASVAGFTWPFLVTLVYFFFRGGLSQMLADWVWPLENYTAANRMPYGYVMSGADWAGLCAGSSWLGKIFTILLTSPFFIIPLLPFLALGFLVFHSRKIRAKNTENMTSCYFVLVSATALGLVFSACVSHRPDLTHLTYVSPPLFVVLSWILDVRGVRSKLLVKAQPLLVVYFLIFFTAFGMTLLWRPLNAHHKLQTRRGVLRIFDPDAVLDFIQAHVPPGGRMFVYPYQPLYYFLAATAEPTRFPYLQPGMHTAEQFREAINDLEADQTPMVFYDLSFAGERIPAAWPATPPHLLDVDPVRDFIFAHYKPCRALPSSYWRFVFMVRKDLSCPAGP